MTPTTTERGARPTASVSLDMDNLWSYLKIHGNPAWADRPTAVGNSALRGARMLLLAPSRREDVLSTLLAGAHHVELASDPNFQDVFVTHMGFPAGEVSRR